jgi:hypothetical protein
MELKRVEDPARDEDVVVFFAVERNDDTLKCTVDISTGEGVVLADGRRAPFRWTRRECGRRAFSATWRIPSGF